MLTDLLQACVIGGLVGYLYGLFKLKAHTLPTPGNQAAHFKTVLFYTFARIVLFSLICLYMLLTSRIHFILALICFLMTFWGIIVYKKAVSHGKS